MGEGGSFAVCLAGIWPEYDDATRHPIGIIPLHVSGSDESTPAATHPSSVEHSSFRVLQQGAAAELKAASDDEPTSSTPSQDARTTAAVAAAATVGNPPPGGGVDAPSTTSGGVEPDAARGARKYLREVGSGLPLSGLRPCTTYRLTMEVPLVVRNDLLESARCAVGEGGEGKGVATRYLLWCTFRRGGVENDQGHEWDCLPAQGVQVHPITGRWSGRQRQTDRLERFTEWPPGRLEPMPRASRTRFIHSEQCCSPLPPSNPKRVRVVRYMWAFQQRSFQTTHTSPAVSSNLFAVTRSLGVAEAVLSLEAAMGSENDQGGLGGDVTGGGDGGTAVVGGGAASSAVHLDIETLPDVPGEVPIVTCKVSYAANVPLC